MGESGLNAMITQKTNKRGLKAQNELTSTNELKTRKEKRRKRGRKKEENEKKKKTRHPLETFLLSIFFHYTPLDP